MRAPDYVRAADMACKSLLRLSVTELPVHPLEILRICRDTQVMTFDRAAELLGLSEDDFARLCGDADAFTIREGGRYVVCYRVGGNPARLNFTLAHELGHIVLGHEGEGDAEEAEADHFAMHLLTPRPAAEAARTADELARRCYVSLAAARMAMTCRRPGPHAELLTQVEALLHGERSQSAETMRTAQ